MQDLYMNVTSEFSQWGTELKDYVPNIMLAILLIVAFYVVAKIVKGLTIRGFKKARLTYTLSRLIANTIYFAVIVLGFFLALGALNLEKTVISLLAGLCIVGIALGFAFQDLATNYISGFLIAFQKPFKRGDQLETNGYFGEVKNITLRTTQIRTLDGLSVTIPNKMVLENPLTNYTETDERRIRLDVGVSYADDLEKVKKVTEEAVKGIPELDEKRPVEVFFKEFGDSSINLFVRFWITKSRQVEFRKATSEAVMRIKKAYDKAGITIPWPIRTLDFDIKGGAKLSKMLK
jgi:small conductance mechanosensitive channel